MRIIAKKTLVKYYELNKAAKQPLLAWYDTAKKANWKNFNEVKNIFRSASIVGNERIVFNIKGNELRLIVKADFNWQILYIRFIGTHKEYNKIDAVKI